MPENILPFYAISSSYPSNDPEKSKNASKLL